MPCARQHIFHKLCLLKWLDSRNTCPICRHGLPQASEAELAEAASRRDEAQTPEEGGEAAPAGNEHLDSLDA